ncbi:DsbA family protein [soil metagenome]
MQVRFYFDPLCPWCWVTSHWLHDEVAPHRDLQIDWRPISLKVRNEDKQLDPAYAERATPAMERSFNLLRVVEAMRDAGRADQVHDAYVAFGRHFHHGEDGLEFDVAEALTGAGIDPSFAAAYDEDRWDDAIRASTKEAEAVAGDDVGTPVIAYEVDGEWKGYFGPVIPSVVRGDAALQLWDGLAALIQTDGFYELKRTRSVGIDLSSVDI